MTASTELLLVGGAFAVVAGVGGWLGGHPVSASMAAGGVTGVVVFLLRVVEGSTVARMPWDRRMDALEARLNRLDGQGEEGRKAP